MQQVSWLQLYLSNDVTIQIRTRYAPCLTKCTIELMKERDTQQKIASETRRREDWQKFKVLRNRINNRLKKLAESKT